MGLFEKWDCTTEERQLLSGDTLVLYTDGATESLNNAGEEFGEERLLESLRQHRELSPQELLAAVTGEVRHFNAQQQTDDITLIIAKCA